MLARPLWRLCIFIQLKGHTKTSVKWQSTSFKWRLYLQWWEIALNWLIISLIRDPCIFKKIVVSWDSLHGNIRSQILAPVPFSHYIHQVLLHWQAYTTHIRIELQLHAAWARLHESWKCISRNFLEGEMHHVEIAFGHSLWTQFTTIEVWRESMLCCKGGDIRYLRVRLHGIHSAYIQAIACRRVLIPKEGSLMWKSHPPGQLLRNSGGDFLTADLLPIAYETNVIGVSLGVVSSPKVLVRGGVLRSEENVKAAQASHKPGPGFRSHHGHCCANNVMCGGKNPGQSAARLTANSDSNPLGDL